MRATGSVYSVASELSRPQASSSCLRHCLASYLLWLWPLACVWRHAYYSYQIAPGCFALGFALSSGRKVTAQGHQRNSIFCAGECKRCINPAGSAQSRLQEIPVLAFLFGTKQMSGNLSLVDMQSGRILNRTTAAICR